MTESEQIESIRLAYPRRVALEAARKMIARAAARLVKQKRFPDEHAARRFLFKKAAEFAMSPAGRKPPKDGEDYRPYPATWFNAGHYDNDPAEWQKPNGASRGKQDGTKASRVIDSTRTAVERIENRNRARGTGSEEERGVQSGAAGNVRGRTIEGAV